jgi:hypothetical protein
LVNKKINLPPMIETWNLYDGYSGISRLTDGRLLPEPDYVFNNMGNNDHAELTSAYVAWVKAMRVAFPDLLCCTRLRIPAQRGPGDRGGSQQGRRCESALD